jgi:hypothetical protein
VTVRFTSQGCKVEVTNVIQPNGQWREEIILSVDPASQLALAVEESAGHSIAQRAAPSSASTSRVRATKYGFELVPERR